MQRHVSVLKLPSYFGKRYIASCTLPPGIHVHSKHCTLKSNLFELKAHIGNKSQLLCFIYS